MISVTPVKNNLAYRLSPLQGLQLSISTKKNSFEFKKKNSKRAAGRREGSSPSLLPTVGVLPYSRRYNVFLTTMIRTSALYNKPKQFLNIIYFFNNWLMLN